MNRRWEVVFQTRSLLPRTIQDADAVVLTPEAYLEHDWPRARLRIFIDSIDAALIAALQQYDLRIQALPLRGRPLHRAAAALARACGKRKWTVHISRLGYEDETQAIWQGWANAFPHIRLVLHGAAVDWASMSEPCPDLE